jgi:hypothetical protein
MQIEGKGIKTCFWAENDRPIGEKEPKNALEIIRNGCADYGGDLFLDNSQKIYVLE